MSESAVWFDRKFEFTFPIERHPELCMRLRGTPARIEELLRGQPRDVLVRKPEQKWSIQEQAGHLLDLEPLWLARVGDFLGSSGNLTAADLKNRKTHDADHNGRDVLEILVSFRKARRQLLERVAQMDPTLFSRSMIHPRLQQPMRLVDHLFFVAEHDDHHLVKIWELLKDAEAAAA